MERISYGNNETPGKGEAKGSHMQVQRMWQDVFIQSRTKNIHEKDVKQTREQSNAADMERVSRWKEIS